MSEEVKMQATKAFVSIHAQTQKKLHSWNRDNGVNRTTLYHRFLHTLNNISTDHTRMLMFTFVFWYACYELTYELEHVLEVCVCTFAFHTCSAIVIHCDNISSIWPIFPRKKKPKKTNKKNGPKRSITLLPSYQNKCMIFLFFSLLNMFLKVTKWRRVA